MAKFDSQCKGCDFKVSGHYLCCHGNANFMSILILYPIVPMTQISNMEVIGLILTKMVKLCHLKMMPLECRGGNRCTSIVHFHKMVNAFLKTHKLSHPEVLRWSTLLRLVQIHHVFFQTSSYFIEEAAAEAQSHSTKGSKVDAIMA